MTSFDHTLLQYVRVLMSYLHCTDFWLYTDPQKPPLFFLFSSEIYNRQQHTRCRNDLQTSFALKMTASVLFSAHHGESAH